MRGIVRRALADANGRVGAALLLALALLVLAAPLLGDGERIDIAGRFAAPSWAHPAGTDAIGRDLLARLAQGGAVALGVALATIALAGSLGTLAGIAAAQAPRLGQVILVVFDIIAAFPTLLLALAAVALAGPGIAQLVGLIALTLLPHFGRTARAQTMALAQEPWLEAARAIGAGRWRILHRHILPAIAGPLLVLACLDLPSVIAIEAGMSFLGIGIPPPTPDWGGLLFEGYVHLDRAPTICLFTCLVLLMATLGFTLAGEALRDAAGPAMRKGESA